MYPFLWNDPISNFFTILKESTTYPNHWDFNILYFGKYINPENLPWHYFFVWFLITTPIFFVILISLSLINFLKNYLIFFLKIDFKKMTKIVSGKKLWKTTQQNCTYAKTYEDEGSSATQSKQGAPDEAFGPTNNPGFFSARNGNYPGTSTFGKVYWLCGVNSTWQAFYYITKLRQNRSSGDMYPTLQSGYVMTSTAQTNNARSQTGGNNSQGYGQPWEMMGGIAFNGGGSTGSPFDMFHAQAYAYIKPTTLVST